MKGANKGDNRFSSFRKPAEEKRFKNIKIALSNLSNSNAIFPNATSLSKQVTSIINAQIEIAIESMPPDTKFRKGEGRITYQTLLKNKNYRHLIDAYFIDAKKVSKSSVELSNKLQYDLDTTNLKSEVNRLNMVIEKHFIEDNVTPKLSYKSSSKNDVEVQKRIDACHKIIMTLIEETEGQIIFQDNTIINLVKSPTNNKVVNKEMLKNSGLLESQLFSILKEDDNE
jgi:hypothetical protein